VALRGAIGCIIARGGPVAADEARRSAATARQLPLPRDRCRQGAPAAGAGLGRLATASRWRF